MTKTLTNIKCLKTACDKLGITYTSHDPHGNLLAVHIKKENKGAAENSTTHTYYFVNFSLPFNDESISKICQDKEFSYVLLRDNIRMPKSKGFFDPNYRDEKYHTFIEQKDYDKVAEKILEEFQLPMIVKMNAGSKGMNVFLCNSKEEVVQAIDAIYNKQSENYDYIALAQDYIRTKHEYRVLVLDKEVLLVYEKDISQAVFVGNLSPFHQDNARAIHITDPTLIKRLTDFIQPVFEKIDLEFGGLDILEDQAGNLFLLELNTRPGFSYFLRDNGEEPLVRMYEKVLHKLMCGALISRIRSGS